MVPRSYIHEFLIVVVASLLFPTWNYCSPQSTQSSPNASSRSAAGNAAGASSSGTSSSATTTKGGSLHGIYLVFPFQNSGPASRLDWLSEGLEELTIQGLSSAGEQVYSHSWRLGELERYGIPPTAKLSRATMLHVAEDLAADFGVFGTFIYAGKILQIDALVFVVVCRLSMNQPDQAEEAFALLQTLLRGSSAPGVDFPEVLNKLAIAKARQNKFPAAQEDLKRASALDPDEDDYPFNLGLIAMQQGDFHGAAAQFREASHREPDIPEDRALLIAALEKAGKQEEADQERNAALEAFGPTGVTTTHLDSKSDSLTHLERVTTEIDPETLRFEMESAQARAATGGPQDGRDTPATHLRRARQELSGGQLDAAEREYHVTLAADKGNAAAHLGLGEIARRQGRLDEAVKELQLSLEARDSAMVRTTLARVYLEQKKPALARMEVEHALKLAPNYTEAKQLLEHLQNGKPVQTPPKGGPQ